MVTESEVLSFVKKQHGKMTLDQMAEALSVDRGRIVRARQQAGLNSVRQQEVAKATEEKHQIMQIIAEQGPQTVKELAAQMGLTVSTVNNRICLLKRKGLVSFINPDNINRGNGRWHLSEQTTAPESDQTSGVYMHSLPLKQLPQYFRQVSAA